MTGRRFAARCGWLSGVVAVTLLAGVGQAAEGWGTSYPEALKAAEASGKAVLIDFTGSDWCPPCKRLKAEVFDTDAFKKWAGDNVVLLELDFPRNIEQSDALKKHNVELRDKFFVRGYPTIVLVDAKGQEIGRTGYRPGGAEAWIKRAQILLDHGKLNVEPSLTAALARAAKEDLPLLVIAYDGKGEGVAAPLFVDAALAKYAAVRLVAARVDLADRTSDDAKALVELLKKNSLGEPLGYLVMAVDPAGEKVLYRTDQAIEPARLIEQLEAKLLPIPYNGEWLENFQKAKLITAQRKRPMMLDFTGSDWCRWCIKLDKEVFATDAFRAYAKDNLVLVKLDFPQKKEIAEVQQSQNRMLKDKHGIRGYPTLMLLGPDEKRLGQMGYVEGGPEPFLAKLKEIVK